MIELKSKLRRWGNSLGVIVPQKVIENEKVQEGDQITILIKIEKEDNILEEMFGTFKFKKSIEKLMKEVDKELYND